MVPRPIGSSRHRSARSPGVIRTLLRTLTLPHWRQHRLRTGLTVAGVALGVATVVVMIDVGNSVLASFEHMLTTMVGTMELEVTSPSGTVDERLLAIAAALPDVQDAAGLVEGFVPLAEHPDESLYLVGIDFLGSRAWEEQFPHRRIAIEDELLFVSDPTSVALTPTLAARLHLTPDAALPVVTPDGVRTLHWRGTLGDIAPVALFDGAIGVMDLPAAQLFLNRVDRFDRIGIRLRPGVAVDEARNRLATALGPGVEVASPELRGQQGERALLSLRAMLTCNTSYGIIVGALIVYHTVAVSVRQRRRELALVEMLGIRRRALFLLCSLEAVALAGAGAALGVALGRVGAAAAAGGIGVAVSEIWLRVHVPAATHSTGGAIVAVLVGVGAALVATAIALGATLRMPTVEALRPPGMAPDEGRTFLRPLLLGLLLVASAWLIAFVPHGLAFAPLVVALAGTHDVAYCGVCLMAPALVLFAGRELRRSAHGAHWLPWRLAAENLPRAPGQGGATVAIIAVATGIAISSACLVRSFEQAWLGWIEQHFAADLFVGSGARIRLLAGPPMSPAVARTLASIPGIATVEPFRVLPFRIGDRPTFLQGIAVDDRLAHGGLAMVEGTFAAAAPALRDGRGVLLSDNLATRLGRHRGDEILLPTPGGDRRFRVEGTFIDYQGSLDLGAVGIATSVLAAIWSDESANLFRIWLAPGASASETRTTVLKRLGPGYFVMTGAQFIAGTRQVLDGFFRSTWALIIVIALVGVVGVVNAQLATVLDRTVEIATLRTVGLSIRDLTRSVVLECSLLGLLGGGSGAVLGIMLGGQFVRYALPLVTGWRIPLAVPVALVAAVVLSAATVSGIAGYVPAHALAALGARHRSTD
jgi:putative ABC transport system permease protein